VQTADQHQLNFILAVDLEVQNNFNLTLLLCDRVSYKFDVFNEAIQEYIVVFALLEEETVDPADYKVGILILAQIGSVFALEDW
jgi:hypothetical protein